MRNAEESPGGRAGPARNWRARRGPGSGAGRHGFGRIGYAHGGAPGRPEPFCTAALSARRGDGATGDAYPPAAADAIDPGTWPGTAAVGGAHADLWVLVCGGIAAAAAFAAAFVASGGVATHPAAPGARMPAVVSQACPSITGPATARPSTTGPTP